MSKERKRYKLTFEFDGTDFSGWQIQPDARTVEGVIESAFTTLYQVPIDVTGQGRTDAGVHALCQIAHVDLPDTYTIQRVMHALKGLLPEDVSLKKMEPTPPDFHARFDAVSREYLYRITTIPSPLNRRFAWYVYTPLDFDKLQQCAGLVLGEHDFLNFCIPPDEKKMTTICTITKSEWKNRGNKLEYCIEGNRFLRHMVRRLVGLMTDIASGKKEKEEMEELLKASKVKQKAPAAPPHGLHLSGVNYNNSIS